MRGGLPLPLPLLSLLLLGLGAPAAAQQMPADARAEAIRQVVRMSACVGPQADRLLRIEDLVEDAREQARSGGDAALRRDAEATLEALLLRAEVVREALVECVAHALPDPGGRTLLTREAPVGAAERRLLEAASSLHVFEVDAPLRGPIRVVRGTQVDGEGTLEDRAVQRAVRRVGGALARCWDEREGGPRRGSLDLVFEVAASGRVSSVAIEDSAFAGDDGFEGCVRRAGERIAVRPGARGGPVTVSYRLRFD
jgi:hypothetical protein